MSCQPAKADVFISYGMTEYACFQPGIEIAPTRYAIAIELRTVPTYPPFCDDEMS